MRTRTAYIEPLRIHLDALATPQEGPNPLLLKGAEKVGRVFFEASHHPESVLHRWWFSRPVLFLGKWVARFAIWLSTEAGEVRNRLAVSVNTLYKTAKGVITAHNRLQNGENSTSIAYEHLSNGHALAHRHLPEHLGQCAPLLEGGAALASLVSQVSEDPAELRASIPEAINLVYGTFEETLQEGTRHQIVETRERAAQFFLSLYERLPESAKALVGRVYTRISEVIPPLGD